MQPEESELTKLSKLVQGLDLGTGDSQVEDVSKAALKYNTSVSHMEQTVNILYERCVADWHFSRLAAMVCQELVKVEGEGSQFRAVLLRQMQADFKRKFNTFFTAEI